MKTEQTVHELVMLILQKIDLSRLTSEEVVALYIRKTAEIKEEFTKIKREKADEWNGI